jgi:hypothetical protein
MTTANPIYNLRQHGDGYEKTYYDRFISKEFPSYEAFWQKFVTPLTNRPNDIHFKNDSQLAAIQRGPHNICLSQLHYSILLHLIRVFELKSMSVVSLDHLVFAMSAIVGAQDLAFELLERFKNPTSYDPWLDKKRGGGLGGGREAQKAWKDNNNYPLQHIRDYRNNLVHGRMSPWIASSTEFYFPKVGKELNYFDWRKITNRPRGSLPISDFATGKEVLNSAWRETTSYFESKWNSELLPNI